ncbi:MAG TPA: HD-GYP domain-containing protein, partial [Bacilli bacterium]
LRSMMNMVELKDTYTKNHSESVAFYSVILGQKLGFPSSRLERLNIAAQLHDIGKVGVPDEILKKQGPLSSAEYAVMKTHVKLGEKVLAPIQSLHREAFIIGHHHEHVNGSGYPYQVMMKDIPLEARMISIADAYHAMISKRPYTLGMGTEEAIHRLKLSKGTQFDPSLVDLFCEYLRAPAKHTHRFRPFCLVH